MRTTQTERRSEKEKRKQTEIITQRNSNSTRGINPTAAPFHLRQNLGFQNEYYRMASHMCMLHGEKLCF